MTPGYREIAVAGVAVHAYVGGGRIEGFAAVDAAATSALVDGADVAIRITWAGGDRFIADIVEASEAAPVQAHEEPVADAAGADASAGNADTPGATEPPPADAGKGTEEHHDE